MMDIEQPSIEQENERIFVDYLSRQPITDSHAFTIDLDHFRSQNPTATQDVIRNPSKYYRLVRNYLEKNYLGEEKKKYESKIDHFEISFEGNLGSNFVTPRGMGSKMANELVGVQGIVTKMDLVRSQL